jgi:hypothetical protein
MKTTHHHAFDPQQNGVYRAPRNPDALSRAAEEQEIEWCSLDLTGVLTKRVFLARVAETLRFPAGFGRNWDAMADDLGDLSWLAAGGVVVHWQNGGAFARGDAADFATALTVFAEAAAYWREQSRVMIVLIDENSRAGRALPDLPAA